MLPLLEDHRCLPVPKPADLLVFQPVHRLRLDELSGVSARGMVLKRASEFDRGPPRFPHVHSSPELTCVSPVILAYHRAQSRLRPRLLTAHPMHRGPPQHARKLLPQRKQLHASIVERRLVIRFPYLRQPTHRCVLLQLRRRLEPVEVYFAKRWNALILAEQQRISALWRVPQKSVFRTMK